MSHPYLIHKDYADAYDRIEQEYSPYEKEQAYLIGQESSITNHNDRDSVKSYNEYCDELCKKYNEIYQKIQNKHGYPDGVPTVNMFGKQPTDLENYYSYYRGRRWGEAKGDRMTAIAQKGMSDLKKAISGE